MQTLPPLPQMSGKGKERQDRLVCDAAFGPSVVMGWMSALSQNWSYLLALEPGAGWLVVPGCLPALPVAAAPLAATCVRAHPLSWLSSQPACPAVQHCSLAAAPGEVLQPLDPAYLPASFVPPCLQMQR